MAVVLSEHDKEAYDTIFSIWIAHAESLGYLTASESLIT